MRIIQEGFRPDIIFDAGGYQTTILILTLAYKKIKMAKKIIEIP